MGKGDRRHSMKMRRRERLRKLKERNLRRRKSSVKGRGAASKAAPPKKSV
ncbi:MAG: hypothetical protein JRG91_16340 [Deltaproteobacteria bacterium]|nr:hypothetical protein [Deltaproteobacteria bacterium]